MALPKCHSMPLIMTTPPQCHWVMTNTTPVPLSDDQHHTSAAEWWPTPYFSYPERPQAWEPLNICFISWLYQANWTFKSESHTHESWGWKLVNYKLCMCEWGLRYEVQKQVGRDQNFGTPWCIHPKFPCILHDDCYSYFVLPTDGQMPSYLKNFTDWQLRKAHKK